MTIVLLSLRPEFAARILAGQKRFEFRRTRFRRCGITAALMYSNSTERRIVGAFEIDRIHEASPRRLWLRYHLVAGIDERAFFEYYEGADRGYAIGISRVHRFAPATNPRTVIPGFVPPQSFCYLSATEAAQLLPPGLSLGDVDPGLSINGRLDEPMVEEYRFPRSGPRPPAVRAPTLCR